MAMRNYTRRTLAIIFISLITSCFIAGQAIGGLILLSLLNLPISNWQLSSLWQYWSHYRTHPDVIEPLNVALFFSGVLPFGAVLITLLFFLVLIKREELHGSARFANDDDLAKSGLFPKRKGFFAKKSKHPSLLLGKMDKGRFENRFVEMEGQTFVGLAAPTGSGKGVGFVIPNLVNYSDSVVCVDVKLENFMKTAGFRRSAGQEIFLFSPDGYDTNPEDTSSVKLRSHRWNPFHYVRRHPAYRVGDIQVLSTSLYPTEGVKEPIWPTNAGKLFTGLALWMLETEDMTGIKPSMPYLLNIVGVEGGLNAWMKSELKKGYLSQECTNEFNAFISYPKDTSGSVLANFNTPLAIYADQTVGAAVSDNDFDFNDLRRKGMTIYVGIQPGNLPRFKQLLNLFFEQLISVNTRVLPEQDSTLTHQCLLLLDEFPSLGKINQIKVSIGFTRQYNLRYAIIYQNPEQNEDIYGKEAAKTLSKNLAVEVVYPPKEVDAYVEKISKTLGTKTVKARANSSSQGKSSSKGQNTTQQKRSLMMPHEIVELGHKMHPNADIGTDILLLKENTRPFIMKKLIYFDEPVMQARVKHSLENIPEIPLLAV